MTVPTVKTSGLCELDIPMGISYVSEMNPNGDEITIHPQTCTFAVDVLECAHEIHNHTSMKLSLKFKSNADEELEGFCIIEAGQSMELIISRNEGESVNDELGVSYFAIEEVKLILDLCLIFNLCRVALIRSIHTRTPILKQRYLDKCHSKFLWEKIRLNNYDLLSISKRSHKLADFHMKTK